VIERVLSIVDAAAIERVPPEIVRGWFEVRLLIESVTLLECKTLAAMLIVTSSAGPGTAFVFQFPALSQLLSPVPPVQVTADSSVRGSIHSIRGRRDLDRFKVPYRFNPNGAVTIAFASKAAPGRRMRRVESSRAETTFTSG
jgi:hypothetical protein